LQPDKETKDFDRLSDELGTVTDGCRRIAIVAAQPRSLAVREGASWDGSSDVTAPRCLILLNRLGKG
jgi:hypothetical protein